MFPLNTVTPPPEGPPPGAAPRAAPPAGAPPGAPPGAPNAPLARLPTYANTRRSCASNTPRLAAASAAPETERNSRRDVSFDISRLTDLVFVAVAARQEPATDPSLERWRAVPPVVSVVPHRAAGTSDWAVASSCSPDTRGTSSAPRPSTPRAECPCSRKGRCSWSCRKAGASAHTPAETEPDCAQRTDTDPCCPAGCTRTTCCK